MFLDGSLIARRQTEVLSDNLSSIFKELLHHCAAFLFQYSGHDFNAMIQEIRITNPKARLNRTCAVISCAVDQASDPCLDQRSSAHGARLNG
jgi:hypothetical protein